MSTATEVQGNSSIGDHSVVLTVESLATYRQMLTFLFTTSIIAIALISGSLLFAYHRQSHLSILTFVALAGAVGAIFSALTRLYSVEKLPQAIIRPDMKLRKWHLLMYALIPPLVGAIGALFFYLSIAAGLIQGEPFQRFACEALNSTCNSLNGLFQYLPISATDYAKSLVWGFVAGFSERLVPNALTRLEKGGNQ
jgi:hypothetical protein